MSQQNLASPDLLGDRKAEVSHPMLGGRLQMESGRGKQEPQTELNPERRALPQTKQQGFIF